MYCSERRIPYARTLSASSVRPVPYILFKSTLPNAAVRRVCEVRQSVVVSPKTEGKDVRMPAQTCVVCGSTPTQDPDASFHRFLSDPVRRASWLDAFGLEESQLRTSLVPRPQK